MTQRKLEAVIGLALTGMAAVFYVLIIPQYGGGDAFSETPPDLLAKVCTGLIGGLGAMMFLHRAFLMSEDGSPPEITLLDLRQMTVIIAIFAGAIIIMRVAGYLVGGAALVAALMVYMRTRNVVRIVITAAAVPAVLYGLFELLLGVPLP